MRTGDGSRLAGVRVLVAGAGVSGRSATEALLAEGALVTVTDGRSERLAALACLQAAGATLVAGLATPPEGTELVVTSPGWRPDAPLLAEAAASGIEVIGEVELAWRMCDGSASWLAVTGTNGKTTTVGMLASILRAAGCDAVACGNVGLPVVDAVRAGHEVLAVELSSFQLHWAPSVRPLAGVVLNVAEDHLDWHGSQRAYAEAKARVLVGDVAVAGVDDVPAAELLAASPAPRKVGVTVGVPGDGQLGIADGRLVDRAFGTAEQVLADVEDVRPAGPPGLIDALAAAALARVYGTPPSAVRAGLRAFVPGAHRAEEVARTGGVVYVNDSKATNPHAAAASLRAYNRVVWVAGGLLKGASVEVIDALVAEAAPRLAGVVLLGADRDVIAAALARHAPEVPVREVTAGEDDAMAEVVRTASDMAQPGTTVLLAPAAASMDMFVDYAHRGAAFAAAARALADGEPVAGTGAVQSANAAPAAEKR